MKLNRTHYLETPRLILRKFTINDAQLMYKNWANDAEVTRYMNWFPHKNIQETMDVLTMWEEKYANSDFYHWAIVLKKSNEPIGSISVVKIDRANSTGEIGFCIGKSYWHQGFVSEAFSCIIQYLLFDVGLQELTARHDVRNPYSGGVMRKCGMEFVETKENIGCSKEGETINYSYYSISRKNI